MLSVAILLLCAGQDCFGLQPVDIVIGVTLLPHVGTLRMWPCKKVPCRSAPLVSW